MGRSWLSGGISLLDLVDTTYQVGMMYLYLIKWVGISYKVCGSLLTWPFISSHTYV